jgi:O-antigen/teichoic acid export membrane protein
MRLSAINKEIKDVFYLIALQGLNYIAPLLVLPYLMKVLGAEKFGYIGFSLSVMQYLMLIVDFGFNLSATKRIALAKGNKQELNEIFSSTFYAKLGLLFISFLVLLLVAFVPRFEIYRETLFIMFLMVIGNTFSFVWLLQGLGEIRFISIFSGIAKLSILPLTFIFVKKPDDYLTAAFLQSLVVVVATLITIIFIIRKHWVTLTSFVRKDVIYDLKESYPIFLSGAATSIYTASFVVVLGYFGTSAEVGQYSAVERIMRAVCYLPLIPVLQVFYPKITQLGKEQKQDAIFLIRKLAIFVGFCMFIVFIGMFFFSSKMTHFLGDDYQGSNALFKIMAFAPVFIGLGGVFAQLGILALGNRRDKQTYQKNYFIAGIVALVSMFLLIPILGTIGAAIALLLTEAVVFLLMTGYSKKFGFFTFLRKKKKKEILY